MNRQSLWSVIALGAVIASLSGAGVVAVFSDTATTGTNEVSSGDQPHFEGLKIANGRGSLLSRLFGSNLARHRTFVALVWSGWRRGGCAVFCSGRWADRRVGALRRLRLVTPVLRCCKSECLLILEL